MSLRQKYVRDCDGYWQQLIALRAKHTCESCGASCGSGHHIIKRRYFATRWDLRNGVYLCNRCHHLAETEQFRFLDWLLKKHKTRYWWAYDVKPQVMMNTNYLYIYEIKAIRDALKKAVKDND